MRGQGEGADPGGPYDTEEHLAFTVSEIASSFTSIFIQIPLAAELRKVYAGWDRSRETS